MTFGFSSLAGSWVPARTVVDLLFILRYNVSVAPVFHSSGFVAVDLLFTVPLSYCATVAGVSVERNVIHFSGLAINKFECYKFLPASIGTVAIDAQCSTACLRIKPLPFPLYIINLYLDNYSKTVVTLIT